MDDPLYRAGLMARARAGKLAPPVETMLWHYAKGKPKDIVELTGKDGAPLTTLTEAELAARAEAIVRQLRGEA